MSVDARSRLRIAVLCGGPSAERDVSLASGGAVCRALEGTAHDVVRLEIGRDGRWLLGGSPDEQANESSAMAPVDARRALAPEGAPPIDVAFVALHGRFGEDGTVQGLLEAAGIPYTGSGVLASALAMDKERAKAIVASTGVRVARGATVSTSEWRRDAGIALSRMLRYPGVPAFVKPCGGGSSIGAGPADDVPSLRARLDEILSGLDDRALVEERLVGREVTCAVLGNRGRSLKALPVVEIVPRGATFFDYRAKYEPGASEEICPARIAPGEASNVVEAAMTAHRALGCDGMSRSDFILVDGAPVYLETNTIPGMTATSLCPKAANAAGMRFEDLVRQLVGMALDRDATRRHARQPI